METITTNKKTYYTADFSAFTRSSKNLRGSIERQDLLALIKNDGGVRDLCFVLPSTYNVDGKRLIWEGSSRHWCLEQLANDESYQGSLDLPFLIIPEESASSEPELIKFMLSANSTDKRFSPHEQWAGISQLLDIYELDYPYAKDPRNEAALRIAEELGKHHSWIRLLRRVYETESNPLVIQMLNDGLINGADSADEIRGSAKKLNMSVEDFVPIVLDHVHDAGKHKITDTYIRAAVKAIKSENDLEKKGVEDILNEYEDILNDQEIFKKIEEEDILNEDILKKIDDEEYDEKETIVIENREVSIDKINFFADFIKLLTSEDWKKLDDKQLIAASKKIDSVYMNFDKSLEKVRNDKKVKAPPIDIDIDQIGF